MPFDPSTKELVLGEIFEVLRGIPYMWEELGAFLGIPHYTIREIHSDDVEKYSIFLPKPEEATIGNLISAIHIAFKGSLPSNVEQQIMKEMAMYKGIAQHSII